MVGSGPDGVPVRVKRGSKVDFIDNVSVRSLMVFMLKLEVTRNKKLLRCVKNPLGLLRFLTCHFLDPYMYP